MMTTFKKVTYSIAMLLLLFICHSVGYAQQVSRTVSYEVEYEPYKPLFGGGIHKKYSLPENVDPEKHFQLHFAFDLTPEQIMADVTGTMTFDQDNETIKIRGRDGNLRSKGGILLEGVINIAFEIESVPFVTIDPVLIAATLIINQVIEEPIPVKAKVPIPGFPQIDKTWDKYQSFESLLLNGEHVELTGGVRDFARVELQARDVVEAIISALTTSAGVPLPGIAINALGTAFEIALGDAAH